MRTMIDGFVLKTRDVEGWVSEADNAGYLAGFRERSPDRRMIKKLDKVPGYIPPRVYEYSGTSEAEQSAAGKHTELL